MCRIDQSWGGETKKIIGIGYTIAVTDTQYMSLILAVQCEMWRREEENNKNGLVCVKSRTVEISNATNFRDRVREK